MEYARAGADITQTFTFYSRDVGTPEGSRHLSCREINQASCDIARSISARWGTIIAGGIVQTGAYKKGQGRLEVQKELKEGLEILIENDIELIIVEYFHCVEEMEWALELALSYDKPVAATMCIGPTGDGNGVSPGECAVRMARAGAPIIGVNCLFDPFLCLETIRQMKEALDSEGLRPFLMAQPLGYKTPDTGSYGWITLPDYPFALEPRQITRWEAARFAREAYEAGVRVIGGCCGLESHHVRAMAEELSQERGRLPAGSDKSDHDLSLLAKKAEIRREQYESKGTGQTLFDNKSSKKYWWTMNPSTGRPLSQAFCCQTDPALINKGIFK